MPRLARKTGRSVAKPATAVKPRYLPIPCQDSLAVGRLILRDGTSATLRLARLEDQEEMAAFFARLSPASKVRRFFSPTAPSREFIESFCDNANPQAKASLVVLRTLSDGPRIVATGSYIAKDETTAEVALAVDDGFQGKGIGTLLLERLALLAVAHGLRRFWAVTDFENQAMLDVFRDSGVPCEKRTQAGYVEVDLSVLPNKSSVAVAALRDRVATTASLSAFFKPRAVAVVGASRHPESIGGRLFNALVTNGFGGPIYPVNPHAEAIGSRAVYRSVRDLPEPVDLAVIAVPMASVPSVVDDCAARGVRALIVITAGFAETGSAGRIAQHKLLEQVRGYGMRMIGPNCLGLMNVDPAVRLNASFAPDFPPPGRVAFSSQSGALGLAIISLARQRGLGLSKFVSVGNKADVSGNDLLQYWEEDPQTDVILLYLESFGNPRRFARIAKRVSQRKPIVVVKSGRTGAGKRAASSHTAALAASDVAVDALFHQTGVIRAESIDEMFDLAAALSMQPLPSGRRVAILTNAGGLGILCADTCEANGLVVQELSESTKNRLKEFLPVTASVANPIDMIASASADDFRKAVEILLSDEEIDSLIVLTIHVGLADIAAVARGIAAGVSAARARPGAGKPVLTCIMDGDKIREPSAPDGERLPNYPFPEHAARVLGKLVNYSEWRKQSEGVVPEFDDIEPRLARALCQNVLKERGSSWLSAEDVRKVLAALALPLPRGGVCRTADEGAERAHEI
ncbi:MAG: GNAT family N-acetyltransferase, partial [Candidatus Binatia bacterium]